MTSHGSERPTRRRLLAGVAAAVGLAGCVDQSGDGTAGAGEGDGTTDDPSMSSDQTGENESGEGGDGEDEPGDGGNETDGGNESGDGTDESECETENPHEEYDQTEVRVTSPEGEELGSVTAAIADTDDLRFLGLSDTECLPEDRGMLFVYDSVASRTFVMRDMDFPIDIVYADDEGVITSIHHAEAPGPDEDGEEPHHQYPGEGQYVLEVNYEWTTDRCVETGDVLAFDL